ncbi:hypothetical protein [Okeania sp. KiyG1]|uniref:hypothetical protein n=1 Tax=Okeania sp. KiyG1 TaxID=2720165 RepID=UPI00192456BA|nr:hypothetical protein [Okeania sp. KiyG1]GGA20693.1 hypothetical protein CYANOKiyG1_35670 [Okeania sp. KiyG1]
MNINDIKIAFISCFDFEDGNVIRGSILVTDYETKPLEFRVTEPIRPTNFQETLYGELLKEHIFVELIAAPLLTATETKSQLILVQEPLLLEINTRQEIPTILVIREDEPQYGLKTSTVQLNSINSNYPPLILTTSDNFSTELESIAKQLESIYYRRNILEPFDRSQLACQQVHEQNDKGVE